MIDCNHCGYPLCGQKRIVLGLSENLETYHGKNISNTERASTKNKTPMLVITASAARLGKLLGPSGPFPFKKKNFGNTGD
jgi:hypothetical protein